MNRIIRVKSEKGFTVIPNVVFSSDLSLRAIGLLTYVLHLPDDWVLHKHWLYENAKEGRDAIKSAWRELEEKGYIETVKESRQGGGKFGGTSYIIYDTPTKTAGNQSADFRPSANRPPETSTLLNTKKQRTKKQRTNVPLPNGNGAHDFEEVKPVGNPPVSEQPPPGCAPPPKEEKKPSTYQQFVALYDEWFKKLNDGVPPNYNNGNGTAAKNLIVYFRKIASERAKKDGVVLDEAGLENKLLEGWQYVLNSWTKLDNFLQGKTRLIDINSNILNIITQIKNGHSKSKQQPATGGNVSTYNLAATIAKHYAGAGSGAGSGNPAGQ